MRATRIKVLISLFLTGSFISNVLADEATDLFHYKTDGTSAYGVFCYQGTNDVEELVIPGKINNTENVFIHESAFRNMQSIKKVIIEEGIKEIQDYAFFNCQNLESVELPVSVEYIGTDAFGGNQNIQIGVSNAYEENYCRENQLSYVKLDSYQEDIPVESYEKKNDWNDIMPEHSAVQIDDIFIYPGMKMETAIEQIQNSVSSFEYEYNPSALLLGKGGGFGYSDSSGIDFRRNGQMWFTLYCQNIFSETMEANELPVTSISVYDAAKPHSRILDGRKYSDLLEMTYKEVLDLQNNIFTGWEVTESSGYWEGETIVVGYNKFDVEIDKMDWTQMRATASPSYYFNVDKDTGKVISVEWKQNVTGYKQLQSSFVRSVIDISDEELLSLINESVEKARIAAEQAIYQQINDSTAEFAGYICDSRYLIHNIFEFRDMGIYPTILVKGILNGNPWYRAVFVNNLYRNYSGQFEWNQIEYWTVEIPVDSPEAAIGRLVNGTNEFNVLIGEDQTLIISEVSIPTEDISQDTIFYEGIRNDLF